jgi:hypothetical protein
MLKGSTGALVGRVSVYAYAETSNSSLGAPIGLCADSADPTTLALIDGTGKPWAVKVDPAAGTGVRVPPPATTLNIPAAVSNAQAPFAAGSPFSPGGIALTDYSGNTYPIVTDYGYKALHYDGTIVASEATQPYCLTQATAASVELDRNLLVATLTNNCNNPITPPTSDIGAHFIALDQAADAPTFTDMRLPWQNVFAGYPDYDNTPYVIATNPVTGLIIVGMSVRDQTGGSSSTPRPYYPQVWAIQGPSTTPNLSGKPLDSQLLFSGSGA